MIKYHPEAEAQLSVKCNSNPQVFMKSLLKGYQATQQIKHRYAHVLVFKVHTAFSCVIQAVMSVLRSGYRAEGGVFQLGHQIGP